MIIYQVSEAAYLDIAIYVDESDELDSRYDLGLATHFGPNLKRLQTQHTRPSFDPFLVVSSNRRDH